MKVIQVVGLMLFSSVKFLFAPSTVYLSGYSFLQTVLITTGGGAFGVFVFFYSGRFIFAYITARFARRKGVKRKTFTRRNRLLIRVKNSYGLYGLALVSPCLISIPIGCFLAAKYFRHDRRTIPVFLLAVVFWSLVLTTVTSLIGPIFD